MAQYNFQGELDNISEPQLQFIKKIIEDKGFENSKVTFEAVGKAGDNFIANVKRIVVESEKGNFNMIAKIGQTVEVVRKMTQSTLLFKNENLMYTEVLPTFVQLQKSAGVPESEHLRYAKCYGSQTEEPHEVILLEDLKESQYVMLDRLGTLSNDCVKSVLKNFAILHSLSYVLKQKDPEKFNSFKTRLVDTFQNMASDEMMQVYFGGLEEDTLAILEDPEHIKCFKNKITDSFSAAAKLSKVDCDSKYCVIQQGDAWMNNFMFKFQEDKVTDSIMIDYQQAKSISPVADIMHMIFSCTDYESRKQNFYDWLDYYHFEFDNSLSNFNLKANYIYPRDKLDADLKRYGKLMFAVGVLVANMVTRKSEDTQKIMERMQQINPEELMEQTQQMSIGHSGSDVKANYKNKVIGLINSFNEFGLL